MESGARAAGALVWIFFNHPVAANVARKMGCHLITETMARRNELSMKSYDRLFPNHDTMPRGGFGNLIALPLQHEPRKHGNTVFLNDQLESHPDQWAYLNSVARMTPKAIEELAREATRKGQVVGVKLAESGDGENEKRLPGRIVLQVGRRRSRSRGQSRRSPVAFFPSVYSWRRRDCRLLF